MSMPGILQNRRTIRAPVNPLDKSTIVSVYPQRIDEIKHTIQPGRFTIEPGNYDSPSILVVGPSSWWREIDEGQPMLEIPHSSIQIADSIVRDYCIGLLACDMDQSMPGLFYVQGSLNVVEVRAQYQHKLDDAKKKQRTWYSALVKLGDALWSRSNGNPLAISDQMKLAASELGLIEKDWLKDFSHRELVRCKACGQLNDSMVVVCPNCNVILDEARFKRENFQFANSTGKR